MDGRVGYRMQERDRKTDGREAGDEEEERKKRRSKTRKSCSVSFSITGLFYLIDCGTTWTSFKG